MSNPSLFSLPVELLFEIVKRLPILDVQNLAAVHSHLRQAIDLNAIREATHSANLLHQLWAAKQSSQFRPHHQICCDCLRLRPNAKFTISLGRDRRNTANLFCNDCGIKGSKAPEAWCKKCKVLSLDPNSGGYQSDRNCIRNAEL